MANTILVGAQWGDEGKGKIIDVLTRDARWVVRFQGGNNAGHTVEIEGKRYVLHLIPSGILRPGIRCVIGHGVVVDPLGLLVEIDKLHGLGVETAGRLFLSDRAHMVLPYHRKLDAFREGALKPGEKIGTTQRGIGPAYTDKAARTGFRLGDSLEPDFESRLLQAVRDRNATLVAGGAEPLPEDETVATLRDALKRLAPYIADTVSLVHDAVAANEPVLFEGAQGTMLDVDFGTYPFVTSSNCSAGGACCGSGLPPGRVDRVYGVVKAYTTRVGEGPFPTELLDDTGERIRQKGREFGSTTGRPRRCGWFDAVVARYAAAVNGLNGWALTKLDVLDGLPVIRIATAYRIDGSLVDRMPSRLSLLAKCEPVYEDHPGWSGSTAGARSFSELPPEAQSYVRRLEAVTGVKAAILSVGPGRESTFMMED